MGDNEKAAPVSGSGVGAEKAAVSRSQDGKKQAAPGYSEAARCFVKSEAYCERRSLPSPMPIEEKAAFRSLAFSAL